MARYIYPREPKSGVEIHGAGAVNVDWLTDLRVVRRLARGADVDTWDVVGYWSAAALADPRGGTGECPLIVGCTDESDAVAGLMGIVAEINQ